MAQNHAEAESHFSDAICADWSTMFYGGAMGLAVCLLGDGGREGAGKG